MDDDVPNRGPDILDPDGDKQSPKGSKGAGPREYRPEGVLGHLGGASLREHKSEDVSWVQYGPRGVE